MNIYLIFPGELPIFPEEKFKKLKEFGEVFTISHKGKIADIEQLKNDPNEKIIGVDPDAFDWDLDTQALGDTIRNVKGIVTSSTSFDWIKPKELKEKGILAINCAGFSSDAVAEYSVAMAIEASRNLAMHFKNNWKIDWNVKPMLLKNKTIGIIGLGRIGVKMAENFMGIGMKVIYWSKNTKDERFEYKELPELFKTVDVLVPALVENDETKNLITHELLDSMKPTAIIVGMNRIKSILDEAYIIQKVNERTLGGYTFEGENAKEAKEYAGNIWPMLPIAWFTQESLDNLLTMWLDNIVSLAQGNPQSVVN